MNIDIKRAYEKPAKSDGYRALIDRVWPRGVQKEQARIDAWLKVLAPSTELRKWFNHEPDKWKEFKTRYFKELKAHREAVEQLAAQARAGKVTLVFASKNEQFNNAVALKEHLECVRI